MGMKAVVAVLLSLLFSVADCRVTGGHLKWMFDANDGYSPYNSPFVPPILKGTAPGDERVAVLSRTANGNWAVDGLSIVNGRRIWDAVLPFTEEDQVGRGVFSANPQQFIDNDINLAFIQVPGILIALDGVDGTPKWQWPIPVNNSLQYVSGWNNHLGLILQGQPIVSPYFPAVIRPTVLATINTVDGSLLWLQNATDVLPLSQADSASYAVEAIEGTRDGLLYSRANKLQLLDWDDGSVIWKTQVSLEGSVGTGQGANITHMRYVPKHPLLDTPDRILLNANNWGFQRFVMLAFNETNTTAPPETLWRSRFPETSLLDVDLTAPTIDNSPDIEMFYYWANRTNWNVGENPTSETYLVGKKMSDGSEVWSARLDPIGLPSTFYGRVFVTGKNGLNAIQGSSGSTLWTIAGDPTTKYSYESSPTFANETGLMVAVRCMQADIPTLCMYSAFDPYSSGHISLFHPWSTAFFTLIFSMLYSSLQL